MLVGDAQRVRADEAEQSLGERSWEGRAAARGASEGDATERKLLWNCKRGCTTGSLTFLRAKVQSGAVFPSVFVREDGEKSCRVSSPSLLISAEPLTLRRVHPTIE